jgi:uncharacterized SAM-dependent methyltransferase
MHLRSKKAQTVAIPGAEFMVSLCADETIWTESSHKYSLEELESLAVGSGFSCRARWIDQEWQFTESLFVAVS